MVDESRSREMRSIVNLKEVSDMNDGIIRTDRFFKLVFNQKRMLLKTICVFRTARQICVKTIAIPSES